MGSPTTETTKKGHNRASLEAGGTIRPDSRHRIMGHVRCAFLLRYAFFNCGGVRPAHTPALGSGHSCNASSKHADRMGQGVQYLGPTALATSA